MQLQTVTLLSLTFGRHYPRNCCPDPTVPDPTVFQIGEKIALSRRIDKHWRLIGWGQIRKGNTIEPHKGN